ncbi:MAG: MerR family transcriptional regulator [Caldilineales bacterium]
MFKIGDFSKLGQVTIKTLRHYDEIGLLRPAQVDPFTSYRYYTTAQLMQLNRILALRDLGLSLEQVRTVLHDKLSAEELRGMLRLKQAELEQQVTDQQERLRRVAARLHQLELEGTMPTLEVVMKEVPALRVAALRGVVENYGAQGELWGRLGEVIQRRGLRMTGPCLTIDRNEGYRERDVDLEVCQPVDGEVGEDGAVRIYDLPAVPQMACLLHQGSYDGLSAAYQQFMLWLQSSGYRITDHNREVYLRNMGDDGVTEDQLLTEIQFPVTRNS